MQLRSRALATFIAAFFAASTTFAAEVHGVVGEAKSSAATDGTTARMRVDRRQRLWTVNGNDQNQAALEGSYFRATNATPGTGIAISSATRTTFTNGEAMLVIRNTASAGGAYVVVDYVRLVFTGTGTAETQLDFFGAIDPNNRYTSGGTTLTAASSNSGDSTGAVADIKFGNVTTAAAVAARNMLRATVTQDTAPAVAVGDEVLLTFGNPNAFAANGDLLSSSDARYVIPSGPVVLGPGGNHSFCLHVWGASMSAAPTAEVEIGWYEY